MLSVLQVTPELNAGGVERTTIEMVEAISRAGGLALVASAGGRLEPDLEAAGGHLIRLPVDSKNPIEVALNVGRLAEAAKARGVTLIHARSRMPGWSALWAARKLKLPFVTTYHGIYNAKSGLKRFYNSVMAKGDVVIANSDYTRAHVIKEHKIDPARVVTVPRGVDLDLFDPDSISADAVSALRAPWNVREGQTVLIQPARLTRWKGQLVLLDALGKLNARRPGLVKLVLAGDAQGRDAYVAELNAAIDRNALREGVVIAGHVAQVQVALAASDIAVFPVIEPEAFGRGAVEAQAMRVPVIASALGGYTETIVEGETGFLVSPGDADALAGAIERLADAGKEARQSMGLRGRDRVRRLYSKAALQASTLAIYLRLLGQDSVVQKSGAPLRNVL